MAPWMCVQFMVGFWLERHCVILRGRLMVVSTASQVALLTPYIRRINNHV